KTGAAMDAKDKESLLTTLKARFEKHAKRHPGIRWEEVAAALKAKPVALKSLAQMEGTGGEPDVAVLKSGPSGVNFVDCAVETPAGRRSLCYDREALDARKENKPAGNAVDLAQSMGITLLTEEQYRELQTLGAFDLKTSSWVSTPASIRKLGGALFCDRRYDHVFT